MKLGIYVHLPFCAVHCSYCDFPLTTRLSLSHQYYISLLKEIEMRRPSEVADTLYFGGGTPSLTPAEVLGQIKDQFRLEYEAETTLEANPDDINDQSLHDWKRIGINRLSIGVQSLEDAVLRRMLRRHSAAQAWQSLEKSRAAGFGSVNVDLIIGAPDQTVDGFHDGIDQLIGFHPQHFSLYLLEVHENTALYKQLAADKVQLMPEEDQLQCYRNAAQMLEHAGYEHYEVSNFALPGHASRHNWKYWTNAPYAGYGAGACSYLGSTRTTNIMSVTKYIEALSAGRFPVASETREDPETEMRNAVIFGLRKREGIDLKEFKQLYGVSPLSLFDSGAEEYLQDGFLELFENRLRLTLSGMLVSNEILSHIV